MPRGVFDALRAAAIRPGAGDADGDSAMKFPSELRERHRFVIGNELRWHGEHHDNQQRYDVRHWAEEPAPDFAPYPETPGYEIHETSRTPLENMMVVVLGAAYRFIGSPEIHPPDYAM